MKITNELGHKIIDRIAIYTKFDVNIMDLQGNIVASSDQKRIDHIHSGAVHVIKTGKLLTLYQEDVANFQGTKPGINFPIIHQNQLVGVVGVSGNPNEIGQVSGLIRAFVEVILDQIHMQQQAYFKERQWHFWLQKLLHPKGFDGTELEDEAVYTLNINVRKEWRVILLKGQKVQNEIDQIKKEIDDLAIQYLFTLPFTEDEVIVVIPPSFHRIDYLVGRFNLLVHSKFRAGIGEVGFGISGIRMSYNQAKQSMDFDKNAHISYSEQWKLKRLITSISDAEFKRICAADARLLTLMGDEYLSTIDMYFKNNLSTKKTAEALYIHRNTLLYRFHQIKEKTGLDLRKLNDVLYINIIRHRGND